MKRNHRRSMAHSEDAKDDICHTVGADNRLFLYERVKTGHIWTVLIPS